MTHSSDAALTLRTYHPRTPRAALNGEALASFVSSSMTYDAFSHHGCEDQGYFLHPLSGGMAFRMRPDRSGTCSNEATLPYQVLQPYMTPEGKTAAERLVSVES